MNQVDLKKYLTYCPDTGVFTRKLANRAVKVGDIAGSSDPTRNGCIRIGVGGNYYEAHQLAFLYMWGYLPDEVDHIDHNTSNNVWTNLRIASHAENGKNQKKRIDNASGVTGVRLRSSGKWRARIYHKGAHIDCGTFVNKEDAIAARQAKAIELDFHRNHGT